MDFHSWVRWFFRFWFGAILLFFLPVVLAVLIVDAGRRPTTLVILLALLVMVAFGRAFAALAGRLRDLDGYDLAAALAQAIDAEKVLPERPTQPGVRGSLDRLWKPLYDGEAVGKRREPLFVDVGFIACGLILILIAFVHDRIAYAPTDWRSQPWYDPLVTAFMLTVSTIFLITGIVRLLRGLHDGTR